MTDDLGTTIGEIADRLDAAAIPYMVVGSIAALVHGRARATMDVDIVVAPDATSLRSFVEALPAEDYYVSLDAALDALRRRAQFNVLDLRSGWKIDLLIRRSRPFSLEELDRRAVHEAFGRRIVVATVEDVIIAKLEWAQMGGSERQVEDARALVELAAPRLDLAYIERHVAELELVEVWKRVRMSLSPGA